MMNYLTRTNLTRLTETIIQNHLVREVLRDKQLPHLALNESLLDSELLDSIAIMEIVAFCEQTFNIEIPEDELVPEHFQTILDIAQLVQRRINLQQK